MCRDLTVVCYICPAAARRSSRWRSPIPPQGYALAGKADRAGGGLLLRIPDGEEMNAALDRIRDGDPFTRLALAQYELLPWNPVIGTEGLDRL